MSKKKKAKKKVETTKGKGGKSKPLDERKKKFAQEYHLSKNATDAAKKAGYSPDHAANQGYRLTMNDDILHELKILKEKSQEKFEITEQMLVNELMSMAFFDITAFMELNEYNGHISFRKDLKDLPGHIRRGLKKIHQTSNSLSSSVSFEAHDKMKAIEMLAQHMGFLKGKNAGADGDDGTNRETTTERINRIFGEYKKRKGLQGGGNSEGGDGS